jgi:glycosyltransferase involved in cell wall biosynthesis
MWTLPARTRFVPNTPVDLREWKPVAHRRRERPLVVHAPSNRLIKGTSYVETAVARLRDEGVAFDFFLVEGLPRAEARKIYEDADLLVEQLLLGWHSALAVELMALGKPVVSYIREDDLKFVPAQMRAELPIVSATPDTITDVLRELLTTRKDGLPELGLRGRAYVERWYDPLDLARRLKADYEAAVASRRRAGRVP